MDLIDAMTEGTSTIDEQHGRVYGWIPGIVTDVDTKLMRVKARIGKQGDNDSTDWLVPMGIGSVESLPEVNDPIGVSFADGDVHRGAYFYFPQSTTKNRPTQHAVLGDVIAGMYNDLSAKMTTLLTNYGKVVTDLATLSSLLGTTGLTVSGSTAKGTFTPTAPSDADTLGKIKSSDGSIVAAKSGDNIALSKRTLVR